MPQRYPYTDTRDQNESLILVEKAESSLGNNRIVGTGGGPDKIPPGYTLGPCPALLVLSSNTNHRACASPDSSAQKAPPVGFTELAPCHFGLCSNVSKAFLSILPNPGPLCSFISRMAPVTASIFICACRGHYV